MRSIGWPVLFFLLLAFAGAPNAQTLDVRRTSQASPVQVTRLPDKPHHRAGETVTRTAGPAASSVLNALSNGLKGSTGVITTSRNTRYGALSTNTLAKEKVPYTAFQKRVVGVQGDMDVLSVNAILETSDGGSLFAGTSSSTNEVKSSTGFGRSDLFVARFDAAGAKLWDRGYGGSGDEVLLLIRELKDEAGYILLGTSSSGIEGNKSAPQLSDTDYWLLKVGPDGQKLWDKVLMPVRAFSGGRSIQILNETSDGGFLIGGTFDELTEDNHGGSDLWVQRLDRYGNTVWSHSYGWARDELLQMQFAGNETVVENPDGGWLIGMGSNSYSGTPGNFDFDYWLLRLDSNGEKIWARNFGGLNDDQLIRVIPTPDVGCIVAGHSLSAANGSKTAPGFGKSDLWIIRVDSAGQKLWDRSFGGKADDYFVDIQNVPGNGFVVLANSASPPGGNKAAPLYGPQDIWVVRLDDNGNTLWEKSFGGNGSEYAHAVGVTPDRGFVVMGISDSGLSGNKTTPRLSNAYDPWIFRLDSNGNKLWEKSFGDILSIYPWNYGSRLGQIRNRSFSFSFFPSGSRTSLFAKVFEVEIPLGSPQIYVNSLLTNRVTVQTSAQIRMVTSFPNGSVYYTLDGSTPGLNSQRFTSSFTINKSTRIRAISYSADFLKSVEADPVDVEVLPTFSVTISTAGGGTVFLDNPSGVYVSNTVARAVATAASGWTFLHWAGATNSASPTLDLVVNGPRSLQAVFGTTLRGTTAGPGSLSFTPERDYYAYNETVTITALPQPGYYLAAWGNAASGTNNPLRFKVTTPTQTVSAAFIPKLNQTLQFAPISDKLLGDPPFQLIASSSAGLPVSFSIVSGSGTISGNQLVITGAGTISVKASQPGNTVYNPAPDLTNTFEVLLKTTISATPGGTVIQEPARQTYHLGDVLRLTALPDAAHVFAGWSGDFVSSDRILDLTLTNNLNLTARFQLPEAPGSRVIVTTLAGSGAAGNQDAAVATEGTLNGPDGPSIGADGSIYFAEVGNHLVRVITPQGGLKTLAGGGRAGYLDASGTNALFSYPLAARALRDGSIVIADAENDVLRRILPGTLEVDTFSGSAARGYRNGPAALAQFAFPNDVVEGKDGFLFVTEFVNHTVRRVARDGSVSTFAGTGSPGSADGIGVAAEFNQPAGIAIDPNGNLYVTEWAGQRVRRITPAGVVTTIAGGGQAGFRDGPGADARFKGPNGIVASANGELFVADTQNHAIRRIAADGTVQTLAGNGSPGFADGDGPAALFNSPGGIALAPDGSLIVADTGNNRIRKITFKPQNPAIAVALIGPVLGGSRSAFQIMVKGQPGRNVNIESSPDLRQWLLVQRAVFDSSGNLQVIALTDDQFLFYRAALAP